MNIRSDIETAAAQWLIRRDRGEESPEQRRAFEHWLAADARHRQAYFELQNHWQRADELRTWLPHRGEVNPRILKEYAEPRRERPWGTYAIAATVLIATLAVSIYGLQWMRKPGAYTTDIGGYQRVVLDDGSIMQLNTNSKAQVRYGREHREIKLLRGEAYFKVAPDAGRPFQVIAADKTVRALGTAFTVYVRDHAALEVTVTEGKVAVAKRGVDATVSAGSVVIVSASQSVSADPSGTRVRTLSQPQLHRQLAWQTGELSFKGETLDQVIAQFNRYNRRQLVLSDPSLAQLQVGGDFQASDLQSFTAALQRSFAVRAEDEGEIIKLFRQ